MTRNTFHKSERLKSRKIISSLFKKGNSFSIYPIRVVWTYNDEQAPITAPAQIAFSVPKRYFKTAVQRNLLRRRILESYRLNKPLFNQAFTGEENRTIALMFLYVAKEATDFVTIETAMIKTLKRLSKEIK